MKGRGNLDFEWGTLMYSRYPFLCCMGSPVKYDIFRLRCLKTFCPFLKGVVTNKGEDDALSVPPGLHRGASKFCGRGTVIGRGRNKD